MKCTKKNYNKRTCTNWWNVPIKDSNVELRATLDDIKAKAETGAGCTRELQFDGDCSGSISDVATPEEEFASVCNRSYASTSSGWERCNGTDCEDVTDATIISELDALAGTGFDSDEYTLN